MNFPKRAIVSIVTVVALALLVLVGPTVSQEKATISTTQVKNQTFVKTTSASGKTTAQKHAELRFQTSGLLSWVGVAEGDTVKAHQALATLDKREVQKNLEKALRDYSSQRNDFEELWRVELQGHHLPNDYLNDTMKRVLEKNQWDLEKAVLDVELRDLALQFATLTTPIAGVVTRVDMPIAGVNITPSTATFEVTDLTSIVFEANIDETDIGLVAVGQKAHVTLDAYPDAVLNGTVTSVAFASQTTGGGGTVFPVQIRIDALSAPRVGYNGDVDIVVSETQGQLVVPIEAIRDEEGGSFVYKKEGTTYKKTAITVVQTGVDEAVISGVNEGDEVVIKGFETLPKK